MVAEKLRNYFGLSEEFSSLEAAKVVIVPCPYEATVSYGGGTKNAPAAVLEASQQVELFDDELWKEPHVMGIHTAPEVRIPPVTKITDKPFEALYKVIGEIADAGKFPITVGGEHSLSLGPVRAFAERYADLSILQIDAHADLRSQYEGNPYSHASASYSMYHALQQPKLTNVGVRNISKEETIWLENEQPNINIFWARKQNSWNFHEIINTLSDNVYLTIDIDGLDASIMPATGTPEPGGIGWYQLMELIKTLCIRKNVVGADIVELAPIPGMHGPDFLVAKLLYKIIGYRYAVDLGVTKKYL